MKAAALNPRVPAGSAGSGCGGIDPGYAHAAAAEIEAVHVPAAAAVGIRRRAGGIDLALAAPEDFVGALLGGVHLHALAVELAVERHADALAGPRGAARGHCN